MNYYNDFEPFAAKWLTELIKEGLIPDGHVDDRSILEVQPDDLAGYNQCHFFAGIGGWSRALQLAGWDTTRLVWSASLPCQPFSCAGQQQGEKDERHLWPVFFSLVQECRPTVIVGEQVASKDGREWLAGIQTDLETLGYSCAAADLPAASVGSPHKRNRLFWMAQSCSKRQERQTRIGELEREQRPSERFKKSGVADNSSAGLEGTTGKGIEGRSNRFTSSGSYDGLADSTGDGSKRGHQKGIRAVRQGEQGGLLKSEGTRSTFGMANTKHNGSPSGYGRRKEAEPQIKEEQNRKRESAGRSGLSSFWSNSAFIPCADGKSRRVPAKWVVNAERSRRMGSTISNGESAKPRQQEEQNNNRESGERCEPEPCRVADSDRRIKKVSTGLSKSERKARGGLTEIDTVSGGQEHHLEIEPILFPLADGVSNRVGILRGAGNSICPQAAQKFIEAVMEITLDR